MVFITVCRTLFYQFLLLFVGLSVGFILNPEWIGIKSVLIDRSVKNIFFPLDYENDPQLRHLIQTWGAYKVYISKGSPKSFEILDQSVYYNDEFYWCRFKYIDKKGDLRFDEGTARVRWKTWEYYYDYDVIDTPEKIKESIKKEKEEIEKRQREIDESQQKEKELLEQNENISNRDNITML